MIVFFVFATFIWYKVMVVLLMDTSVTVIGALVSSCVAGIAMYVADQWAALPAARWAADPNRTDGGLYGRTLVPFGVATIATCVLCYFVLVGFSPKTIAIHRRNFGNDEPWLWLILAAPCIVHWILIVRTAISRVPRD
jgi:hypothetical protein